MSSSKGRFRFKYDFDIHMAREVCGQNPYKDPKRRANVQVNMIQITGQRIAVRTLRERTQNLVTKYKNKARLLEEQ